MTTANTDLIEQNDVLEEECPVCQTKEVLARVRLKLAEDLERSVDQSLESGSGIRQIPSATEKMNLISDTILKIAKCECADEELALAELSDAQQ